MLNQADELLEKAKELLKYCESPAFDMKLFGIKQKNFTDLYKRCDYMVQGQYHEMWREWLNDR